MTGWALTNLYRSETAHQRSTSAFRSPKPNHTYGGEPYRGPTPPTPLTIRPKVALFLDAPTEPEPLLQHEISHLARLGPLITSPRAAKRLLNIYRVVRSTREFSDSARFLGADGSPGEFQAVVVLLGILTAARSIAAEVFANLLAQPSSTTPVEFAVDLGNADCQRRANLDPQATDEAGPPLGGY